VAENAMTRKGGGMFADGYNQLATAQSLERSLDSALRQTGQFGERAQTCRNRFPFVSCSLSVKTKINQKSGRLAIVANEVAHQDRDDVIVDRDFFPKARHVLKDEGRIKKDEVKRFS
jgi:hypothetical protein